DIQFALPLPSGSRCQPITCWRQFWLFLCTGNPVWLSDRHIRLSIASDHNHSHPVGQPYLSHAWKSATLQERLRSAAVSDSAEGASDTTRHQRSSCSLEIDPFMGIAARDHCFCLHPFCETA